MFNPEQQPCDLLRRAMESANVQGMGSLTAELVNEVTHLRKLRESSLAAISYLLEVASDNADDAMIRRIEALRDHIAQDIYLAGVVEFFSEAA